MWISARPVRSENRQAAEVAAEVKKERAPTFDRSPFDSRLQMRFPRGRHCNDYSRLAEGSRNSIVSCAEGFHRQRYLNTHTIPAQTNSRRGPAERGGWRASRLSVSSKGQRHIWLKALTTFEVGRWACKISDVDIVELGDVVVTLRVVIVGVAVWQPASPVQDRLGPVVDRRGFRCLHS
jgi:hypothetical protein